MTTVRESLLGFLGESTDPFCVSLLCDSDLGGKVLLNRVVCFRDGCRHDVEMIAPRTVEDQLAAVPLDDRFRLSKRVERSTMRAMLVNWSKHPRFMHFLPVVVVGP